MITVVFCVALSATQEVGAAPGGGLGGGTGSAANGVLSAQVSYSSDDGGESGEGGGGGVARCSWSMVDGVVDVQSVGAALWPRTQNGVTYHLWQEVCDGVSRLYELAEQQQQPENLLPQLLSQLRSRSLPLPEPSFSMLDPQFGWAYVRVPLDFRAGEAWRTVSVTASVGPVWATVSATPVSLAFDPGDPAGPSTVFCSGDGPTAPYVAESPGECSYTYRNASSTSPVDGRHFATTMTIEWQVSWTSSTGAGGQLPNESTSSSALLAVAEVKGLVTCTGSRPEQGRC